MRFVSCSGECCVCAYGDFACCAAANCSIDCFTVAGEKQIIERLDKGEYEDWHGVMKRYLRENYGYDYDKEKEKKDMKSKKFTMDDLKVGYVVKLANGDLRMVIEIDDFRDARPRKNSKILVNKDGVWAYADSWRHELTRMCGGDDLSIDEVYGFINKAYGITHALDISTEHRPLLWKREEPAKKMTVSEIEKKLGCKIEIVAE